MPPRSFIVFHSSLLILYCSLLGCSSSPQIAQWEYTGGPFAQNISALHISPENPHSLLAGMATGEVFGSTDHGRSWSKLTTIVANQTIHRFFAHPNRNHVYAGTDAGLFVTTDEGKSWSPVRIESGSGTAASCRALMFDPFRPDVMYAGVRSHGLFKSTNGGTRWDPMNSGLDAGILSSAEVFDLCIDDSKPDVLYAAISRNGIVRSTDAGASWVKVSIDLVTTGGTATHILMHRESGETLCIGTNTGNIFRTTNGGVSWSPTRRGIDLDGIVSLAYDPNNNEVIYAGTERGLFVSTDFGTAWGPLSVGLPEIPTAVAVAPGQKSATLHIFGQGIGLQRSTDDGRVWMHEDVHLGGSSVATIVADRKAEKVYASVGRAVYLLKAGSDAWVAATDNLVGGRITSIAFSADSSSILYASTTRGLFRTTNAGETWTQFGRHLRFSDVRFFDTHPVINSRFFASSEQGLAISTDRGVTWNDARPVTQKFRVRALTFTPTNAGLVRAAVHERGIISSTDGGFTWEYTRYGITSDSVIAVTHHPGEGKTLFAWTSTGDGFRSLDNGVSWDRYAPPWNIGDKVHVAFDRYQPTIVVALVNNKQVFYTWTGGATWLPVPAGDLRAEVIATHWNGSTATLFAGTKNAGVYKLSLREILKEPRGN